MRQILTAIIEFYQGLTNFIFNDDRWNADGTFDVPEVSAELNRLYSMYAGSELYYTYLLENHICDIASNVSGYPSDCFNFDIRIGNSNLSCNPDKDEPAEYVMTFSWYDDQVSTVISDKPGKLNEEIIGLMYTALKNCLAANAVSHAAYNNRPENSEDNPDNPDKTL